MPRLSFTWHLAVILLLAAAPRVADACSCWKRGLVESCELSDAVFEGKVVKVVRDKPKGYLTATFAVTRRWKGALQAQVKVMTGLDSSMCGLSFDNAEEWMIYARYEGNGLSAGLCSRSLPITATAEHRAAHGPGLPPVKTGERRSTDGVSASTCRASPAQPTPASDAPPVETMAAPDAPPVETMAAPDAPLVQPTQAATAPPPPQAQATPPPTARPGGCSITTPAGGSLLVGPLLFVLRRRRRYGAGRSG